MVGQKTWTLPKNYKRREYSPLTLKYFSDINFFAISKNDSYLTQTKLTQKRRRHMTKNAYRFMSYRYCEFYLSEWFDE